MTEKVHIKDLDQSPPVAHNFVDRTGQKSGRLTVIRYVGKMHVVISGKKKVHLFWQCACECGGEAILPTHRLSGHTLSCGCLPSDVLRERNTTHGKTRSPEYNNWRAMRERCCNPNSSQYKDYGDRGITICERWLHSFENFLADMGNRPTSSHTIDRIDNSKGYSPDNCQWSTRKEQNRNKRNNVRYPYNGEMLTVVEISERTGINWMTIRNRIVIQGLTVSDAISKIHNAKSQSVRSAMSLASEQYGIPYLTLYNRVNVRGMTLEQAISTPNRYAKHRSKHLPPRAEHTPE